MDNLDKYKGKWCKRFVFNTPHYFLVRDITLVSNIGFKGYKIAYDFNFFTNIIYDKNIIINSLSELHIVNESEVLEQARKYGHKEIVDMLSKKEITKEDLHDCKIWIGDNPELNRQVQEKLFELGFSWLSGNNSIRALFSYAKGHLLIENGRIITFDFLNGNYYRFNHYNSLKEITPEQILSIKTTKSKITSKTDSILQYPNKKSKAKTFQTINLNVIYENSRKSL